MSDAKLRIELDLEKRTYAASDVATATEQEARPLPEGDMPWLFRVGKDPKEASHIEVNAVDEQAAAFDPAHATACSVIAVDAWITDKVFETHDDTIYVVRVVNTSTHYVAEEIRVDIEIDPNCAAVAALLPDKHSLIEIQPVLQCIKCLAPRHYIDLRFVAISRGPMPGVFPVRACVTYDLVYWTRSRARTHARLELEVHDECRPRKDPCRSPRRVPPDPGDLLPAPQPSCPIELFGPCYSEPAPPPKVPDPPEEDCSCDDGPADDEVVANPDEPPQLAPPVETPPVIISPINTPEIVIPPATPPQAAPERVQAKQPSNEQPTNVERVEGRRGDTNPPRESTEADEGKGEGIMSNDKYGPKHDPHHDHHHHHHPPPPDKKGEPPAEKKGCAPACSNADEFVPITEDCRLPEGGMLAFSYTFRKGFVANSNRGGRCVYGKHASNGKHECRLESIDDTVLVMDVTNHSHFHLKHVRIHGIRIFQNHEEVTQLLPSGHPVAQIIPNASYIGSLPRGETKWIALSFITRGVAPGHYAVKFCVDYDIEACSVSAGINVEISCD